MPKHLMAESSRKLRRSLGVICLITAIMMLIAGETILRNWLKQTGPLAMAAYWLTCFAITGWAALLAIRDVVQVRRENRAEQRKLLEQTLQEVERERAHRSKARE
jgi:TRAP-type C4-dicarboxylate transport system permease small subunit